MRLYTLTETEQLLGIGKSTLRRWLRRCRIILAVDAIDYRRRLVTSRQIRRLVQGSRRITVVSDELEVRVKALEAMITESKKPPS